MRRLIPWIILVALMIVMIVFARPIPNCTSTYGVDDDTTCVYAGYPYRNGVQVG